MSLGQRSHSAAPSDNYHHRSNSPRRGSLSPPDDRYIDYPVLPIQSQISSTQQPASAYNTTRFQSRSATATPTGSPKKRQLPQVSVCVVQIHVIEY